MQWMLTFVGSLGPWGWAQVVTALMGGLVGLAWGAAWWRGRALNAGWLALLALPFAMGWIGGWSALSAAEHAATLALPTDLPRVLGGGINRAMGQRALVGTTGAIPAVVALFLAAAAGLRGPERSVRRAGVALLLTAVIVVPPVTLGLRGLVLTEDWLWSAGSYAVIGSLAAVAALSSARPSVAALAAGAAALFIGANECRLIAVDQMIVLDALSHASPTGQRKIFTKAAAEIAERRYYGYASMAVASVWALAETWRAGDRKALVPVALGLALPFLLLGLDIDVIVTSFIDFQLDGPGAP